MTPGARVAAAIGILDRVLAGEAAEKSLTSWARGARYAGSKDRAAVRDHVFDALRRLRSSAVLGGGMTGGGMTGGGVTGGGVTGRGVMLGLIRGQGGDPAALFTGEGHAPEPPRPEEAAGVPDRGDRLDLPDWLLSELETSLGDAAEPVALALRDRAPVFLRANLLRSTPEAAVAALADEEIAVRPHPLATTALEVVQGARRIARSRAYAEGLVELQDAASQAVVEGIPLEPGVTVLDYCAGGGGKALALAARTGGRVDVHDADPGRMKDLPARAGRAGADLRVVATPAPGYGLVLCDVPCSGSGAWRRAPEGKWRLTEERLTVLNRVQSEILDTAAGLVRPGGRLVYATCSLLDRENRARIDAFLGGHPGWRLEADRRFLPVEGGDGFYVAHLTTE